MKRSQVDRPVTSLVSLRNFIFTQDYPAVYELWGNAGPGIHLRLSDEAG
jgi:hypothetical protein